MEAAIKINCRHCSRYIGEASNTTIGNFLCVSCKGTTNVKIVLNESTPEQLRYKFKTEEQPPKKEKK